jgi:hypothetical protein
MDLRRLSARWLLAIRVGAWLCVLPLRWRVHGLTGVLERIGTTSPRRRSKSSEFDSTIRIVRRVAALGLFRLPMFPRTCLREALALYHVLSHAGQPVEFCVGVRKAEGDLLAHSWVSLHGTPIIPADRVQGFRLLYSYPDVRGRRDLPLTG